MKLAICLPFYNMDCKTYFAISLMHTRWPQCEKATIYTYGTGTAKAKMSMVEKALEVGCTHICVLASDTGWKPDALEKLLAADKSVISGWASSRFHPFTTNIAESVNIETKKFRMVQNPRERHGLERIKMHGEFTIFKREVFDVIPKPWFFGPDMIGPDFIMTDDTYFCLQCEKFGVEVWVDWDVHITHCADGMVTDNGELRAL